MSSYHTGDETLSEKTYTDNDNKSNSDLFTGRTKGNTWQFIRELDDKENWTERTQVVSKADHLLYTECAKDFVLKMVDEVTCEPTVDKAPVSDDFGYMDQFSDKDFETPAHQLDVDFLEKISSSHNSQTSALARESLYVKFDPLVGGASPRRGPQKVSKAPSKQLHTVSDDLLVMETPPHIAVPRASGPISPREQSTFPVDVLAWTPGQMQTHSSTSQDFAAEVDSTCFSADRHNDESLVKVLKYGDDDLKLMIEAALSEERLKHEAAMAAFREECNKKEVLMQKRAEKECQNCLAEVAMHVADKAKMMEELQKWRLQVDKHADSESRVIGCYEKLKEDTKHIEEQRKQAMSDFESLEKSFADLHQRYLKLKTATQALQKNEQILVQQINDLTAERKADQERYLALEAETKAKLIEANQTFENMKKEFASEVAVAKASTKKMTVQIASLQQLLQQKEQEKQELTQICDDLMKELGSK